MPRYPQMPLITSVAQRKYTIVANTRYARRYHSSTNAVTGDLSPRQLAFNFKISDGNIQSKKWQIGQHSSANKRCKQHSPVRERLASQMCQNNFCGHPPKHKAHRHAEKDKSVFH